MADNGQVVLPVEDQIVRFLEAHGYRDFAFVLINPDGGAVRSRWLAGDGEEDVADRKRGGDLHWELEILQAQILAHHTDRRLAAPAPAPAPKKAWKARKNGKR